MQTLPPKMRFESLIVEPRGDVLVVRLHRPERKNSLNALAVKEINLALDAAEADAACRAIILEGESKIFCSGMDFEEAAAANGALAPENYMALLDRFSTTNRIVIAKVDGICSAGGVGLAAAADLVISTRQSQFSLPEALWGLLPCCVIPFLIRRVGFQKAYAMTLTTQPVSAEEAHRVHLVDEVADNPDDSIRKLMLRMGKIDPRSVRRLKDYFRAMWILDGAMEQRAVDEIKTIVTQPEVRERIERFVSRQQMPWMRHE
jgi:polyketide biosynthesis enoyl-CoA hydratase PksH